MIREASAGFMVRWLSPLASSAVSGMIARFCSQAMPSNLLPVQALSRTVADLEAATWGLLKAPGASNRQFLAEHLGNQRLAHVSNILFKICIDIVMRKQAHYHALWHRAVAGNAQ